MLSSNPALPMHLQEQRIVSPETDSGFVGSEASRVSPPMHTPEHQPPSTGYGSGSLPSPRGGGIQGHRLSALPEGIWVIEGEQGWGSGSEDMGSREGLLGGSWRCAGWPVARGQAMGAAHMTHPVPRTPSSLGPSIPVPVTLRPLQKREVTPLSSEAALMGIYPAGRQGGSGGLHLPPSTSSQSISPPHWAESAGSKAGPNGDDSE